MGENVTTDAAVTKHRSVIMFADAYNSQLWNAVTVLCGQLDCDDGHL